jgi:hypothetical protein
MAIHTQNSCAHTLESPQAIFFNLHRAAGSGNVIVATDRLIALAATWRGIPGIVSPWRDGIKQEQLEDAKGRGVKTITLVPTDADEAGILLTRVVLRVLAKGLRCRVLRDKGRSDPLALFRGLSREEAIKEIAEAQPGAQWAIDQVLFHSCYKPDRERDWNYGMNECITILASAEDAGERTDGVEYLSDKVGVSERAINLLVENMALHMEVVREKNRYREALGVDLELPTLVDKTARPVRLLN